MTTLADPHSARPWSGRQHHLHFHHRQWHRLASAKVFNSGMRGQKGSEATVAIRAFLHPLARRRTQPTSNRQAYPRHRCRADLDGCLRNLEHGQCKIRWSLASLRDRSRQHRISEPDTRMIITDSQQVDPISGQVGCDVFAIPSLPTVSSTTSRRIRDKERHSQGQPGASSQNACVLRQMVGRTQPTFAQTTEIHLGHPDHPKVTMTAHDWLNTGPPYIMDPFGRHEGQSKAVRRDTGPSRFWRKAPTRSPCSAGPRKPTTPSTALCLP